jgi:hypothetical protein
MNEPLTNRSVDEMTLEESLQTVLTRQPEPAFVDALEQHLLASQRVAPAPAVERRESLWTRWRAWWAGVGRRAPRLRWAAVPVTVLALLLIALLLIGPERAWAGLQAWLGYVPGVGFVDLDESRLLANSKRVTREGVTLQVVNVVAGPEDTVVVVEIEGLPPEDRFRPRDMPPPTETQPLLRLPGGETLAATGVSAGRSQATFVFPALPADIYQVTLELARLPLLPEGAAPEAWEVALLLQPATGELVAEMYPQPYRPAGAKDTHHGVTLSVLEVAHHPQETALQMELTWENPGWENHFGPTYSLPQLQDNTGNVYQRIAGSTSSSFTARQVEPVSADTPLPPANVWVGEATFEAVPPATEALTLAIDGIDFEIPLEGAFTMDLGENPEIGDSWDLDVTLDVAGFPVQITGAEFVEEEMDLRDGTFREVVLRFDLAPVAEEANRSLLGLHLDARDAGFRGSTGGYDVANKTFRTGLTLDEGAPLPAGEIEVKLSRATVLIKGPWELSWQLPGNADTAASRATLTQSYTPRDASATQAGITLSVLAAAHGEDETALQVRVHWNEPGREFLNGFWETELVLARRAGQPIRTQLEREPATKSHRRSEEPRGNSLTATRRLYRGDDATLRAGAGWRGDAGARSRSAQLPRERQRRAAPRPGAGAASGPALAA